MDRCVKHREKNFIDGECPQCKKERNLELEQSKERLKKIFSENPLLKQAFKETIDEMRTPENVKKMADDIHSVLKEVLNIKANIEVK